MGQFDQTARSVAKMNGAAFFGWTLGRYGSPAPLVFERWDDTRRLVCPGEPDRTNDLVALLHVPDHPERQVWMVVEVEVEPERGIFYRLGQYEFLLGKEVAPLADPDSEPQVGSVLLNLTGRQKPECLQWDLPGLPFGSRVAPVLMDLAWEDASATLAAIEANLLAPPVLPWLALMRGGGDPGLIGNWKRLVEKEVDPADWAFYRDAALVFAELTKEQVNWLRGLEDWKMRESQYIKKFEQRGKEEGVLVRAREDLLDVIGGKFKVPVPEPMRLAIEGTTDPDVLKRWLLAAVEANSLGELRSAMKFES
jgi:hypothetical protein